jgi:hypothetical protein
VAAGSSDRATGTAPGEAGLGLSTIAKLLILPTIAGAALLASPRFSPGWAIAAGVVVLAVAAAGIWVGARPPSPAATRIYAIGVMDLPAVLLAVAVWREFGQKTWLGVLLLAVAIGTAVGAQLRAHVLFAWVEAHPELARRAGSRGGAVGALGYAFALTANRIGIGIAVGKILLPLLFLTSLVLVALMHMLWGRFAGHDRAALVERRAERRQPQSGRR